VAVPEAVPGGLNGKYRCIKLPAILIITTIYALVFPAFAGHLTKALLLHCSFYPYICRVKQLWSIPLLILILAQVAYLPGLSLWLEYNADYIANELCKNRFEPELMCSGSCYIQEVTQEAVGQERQSEKAPVTEDNRPSFSPFLPAHCGLSVERALPALAQLPAVSGWQPVLLPSGVFHPPRV